MPLQKNSEPLAPNVSSPVQNISEHFPVGRCRYCGCRGASCLVPEGQYGYRTCFWLDKEQTVCAAPACTEKWFKDRSAIPLAEAKQPTVITFGALRRYRGLQHRVAKKLGVTDSVVARVVRGITKSARISSALAEEIALIESSSRGQADGAPRVANEETKPPAAAHESIQSAEISDRGKKPFVKLNCVAKLGAAFVASAPGMDECVLIGRNQETGWLSGVAHWARDKKRKAALTKIELYFGIYSRLARQLNLDRSHVRRVALGHRTSSRIEKLLISEVERIEKLSRQQEAA